MDATSVRVFSPAEAQRIVDETIARFANFRSPYARTGERDIPNSTVVRYAEQMRRDLWKWEQATPIRLNVDGTCSDGMHRLLACAISKVPLRSLVLEGAEWSAGVYTDTGRPRSLGQVLASLGFAGGVQKAAASRQVLGRTIAAERGLQMSSYVNQVLLSTTDVIGFVRQHDTLLTHAVNTQKAAATRGLNGTGLATFLIELALVDPDVESAFYADLLSSQLDNADPLVLMLRAAAAHKTRTGSSFGVIWTLNNLIKAFDQRQDGVLLQMWKPPTWTDVHFAAGFHPKDRPGRA